VSCDFYSLATAGVSALSPYVPGKPEDELKRELGLAQITKLASNENPLGPSKKALVAINSVVSGLCRYPDGNGYLLRSALAEKLKVEASQITLGNGSNDVLELIVRAFCDSVLKFCSRNMRLRFIRLLRRRLVQSLSLLRQANGGMTLLRWPPL